MTLPYERTRSLVFGFEFLAELHMADNLTPAQRRTLDDILSAYPNLDEIKAWAADCMAETDPLGCCQPDLALDGENLRVRLPEGFQMWVRPTIEPWQRARALRMMVEFLRQLWWAPNVTAEQKRSIPYVQRHYFERWRLKDLAQHCELKLRLDPTLKVWVLPEPQPQPQPSQQGESQKTGGIHE